MEQKQNENWSLYNPVMKVQVVESGYDFWKTKNTSQFVSKRREITISIQSTGYSRPCFTSKVSTRRVAKRMR